jgi:hypothetical protein
MKDLCDTRIYGNKKAAASIKELFARIRLGVANNFGGMGDLSLVKIDKNFYADSSGKAPLYILAPTLDIITNVWVDHDLDIFSKACYGLAHTQPTKRPVYGFFLTRKEDNIGLYLALKPIEENETLNMGDLGV